LIQLEDLAFSYLEVADNNNMNRHLFQAKTHIIIISVVTVKNKSIVLMFTDRILVQRQPTSTNRTIYIFTNYSKDRVPKGTQLARKIRIVTLKGMP
jgi:hypothetical protein